MKKLISILLVVVMLLSFMSITAFAKTTIDSELESYLHVMDDDDLVWVWIWIKSKIDTPALERQARIECGLPIGTELQTQNEIDMYNSARTRLIAEFHTSENQSVIDKIGVTAENVDFLSSLSPSFIVQLTKEQVYYAVSLDEVTSVNYYEKEIEAPDWNGSDWTESEKYYYKDKFLEAYDITDSDTIAELTYEEDDYLDTDGDGVTDYVLIYAHLPMAHDTCHFVDLGTHFIEQGCYYYPFGSGYALYDIKEDDYSSYTMYMMKKYPFMADYQKEHPKGIPYGDADMDYRLSVLDATEIQRGIAGLTKNGKWDWIIYNSGGVYRSDIDRDGTITILDATTIQVQLANK